MLTVEEGELAALLGELTGESGLRITRLAGGFENETFTIQTEGNEPYVVRLSHRRSVDEVHEELSFLSACARAKVPVAPPLALFGARAFAQTHLGVAAAFKFITPVAPPLNAALMYQELSPALARLLSVSRSFPMYRKRVDYLPDEGMQRSYLSKMLAAEKVSAITFDLASERLARPPTARGANSVIHGDLHPGNVVWSKEGPVLIDFDDSRNATSKEEVLAFARGFCFEGERFVEDVWSQLIADFQGSTANFILADLLGACIFFACAISRCGEPDQFVDAESLELRRAERLAIKIRRDGGR